MNVFLQWQPRFSLHVEELDRQHQKLFDLVNRLHRSIGEECDHLGLSELLDAMTEYLHEHFNAEERYLANHPNFAAHKYEHVQFMEKTLDFLKGFEENPDSTGLCKEIHSFLSRWLLNHTTGLDIEYFNELREKGLLQASGH